VENPCRGCELFGEDKNNPFCGRCTERIEYVRSIGSVSYSQPLERSDGPTEKPMEPNGVEEVEKVKCGTCRKMFPPEEMAMRKDGQGRKKVCAGCDEKYGYKPKKAKESPPVPATQESIASMLLNTSRVTYQDTMKGIYTDLIEIAEREFRPVDLQAALFLKEAIYWYRQQKHEPQ